MLICMHILLFPSDFNPCNCHISFNSAYLYIPYTLLSLTETLTLIDVRADDTVWLTLYLKKRIITA